MDCLPHRNFANPHHLELNEVCRRLPLQLKKKIMTCLRVGALPWRHPRLRKLIGNVETGSVQLYSIHGIPEKRLSMSSMWYTLAYWLQTPTRRSILSVVLRSTAIDEDEQVQAIDESLLKEISATQQTTITPSLQYPFLESYRACVESTMHHSYPFRPETACLMREKFLRWRNHFALVTLYPQVTTKSLGRESAEQLHAVLYAHLEPNHRPPIPTYSTSDLERHYMETGDEVEGVCEVRYAWKFNDLKPRIYYAIGSSAFHASKHIWHIFDSLQRLFSSSDPKSRYSFMRFPIINLPPQVFILYDYASFTSRLADIRRYTACLAEFCDGTSVDVFDTFRGLERRDVGQMLRRYNDVCNTECMFSMERVEESSDGEQRILLRHEVAGLLGVFGNIVSSTSLHGVTGISIAGNENSINTIGDDAAGVYDDMEKGDIMTAVRSIGEIADEKFIVWEEDETLWEEDQSWHYVKRPIRVRSGLVSQDWMPEFPMLGLTLDRYPSHITVKRGTLQTRRRTFIKQTCRFLTSLVLHSALIDDEDRQVIHDVLREAYRRLKLPVSGSFPNRYVKHAEDHTPYPDEVLVVPPITKEVFETNWWQVLKSKAVETGYVRVPVVAEEDEVPAELIEGESFISRGDRLLGVLEKLGVLVKRPLIEDRLLSDETLEILSDMMTGRVRAVFEYHVCKTYEPWRSIYTRNYMKAQMY